ncbi:MAG: alpha/beta hydrolase [Flavobacteriales bacterium]|nr:alpha/beta hydrolase [Bacteroidota bacterium]MCB9240982.1 alpha/beta hydrolase [Flavobacteriales bacterium]
MKRGWKVTLGVLLVLLLIYFVGPKPKSLAFHAALPSVPNDPDSIEQLIHEQEQEHQVKPGNEACIIWFDSLHEKTEYALVYLHGFSASHEEGNPLHLDIARKFGCNLYLPRLADHGIDTTEPLGNFRGDRLWESAQQALAIGQKLGRKVILMGTSTGGSLTLQLAAEYDVAGLVLLSPNIEINDLNAWLLNNPWGLQIARMVKGSNYNTPANTTEQYRKFWNGEYRLEALVQLEEYLEEIMIPETFQKVTEPTLCLYYYKDEQHQDPVVRVSAIKEMVNALSTPKEAMVSTAIPTAGNHVLGSYVVSQDVPAVEREVKDFMHHVLKMPFAGKF